MTTLEHRPHTALVLIDVQNDVVAGAHEGDAGVSRIRSLVERARHERVPVVWVQHRDEGRERGSDGWQIVPELAELEVGRLVVKAGCAAGTGHRPHGPTRRQRAARRAR